MANSQTGSKGLLCGLVVGGLAVGACVALYSSKTGKKLRQDLAENYEELGDKIENFFESLKDNVQNNFHEHVDNLSEKTKDAMKSVKNGIGNACDLENKDFRKGLFVGGALGALLTVGGTIMYKASFEDREASVMDNISQHACKWSRVIKDALENSEELTRCASSTSRSHSINDVLDFAALGLRLWKNMKNKR